MLQALAALLGAALIVLACYAAGAMLIDWAKVSLKRAEKFPLAFVLGASVLHLAVFAILVLKIGYKPILIALPVVVIALGCWKNVLKLPAENFAPLTKPLKYTYGAIFALFTVLYFFHAWAPESSPDGSGYHLGLVARYIREHGFSRITTNIYAWLSEGVEMLFVPAFAVGRHSSAALVHYAFFIALVLAIFAYGRRIGKPWAGATASLLVYLAPIAGVAATSAYIDLAVAAIVFGTFYWLEIWDENRNPRVVVFAGLLAGYCYAAKYTAAVMVIYATGFIAWRSRSWRPLVVAGACAAAMMVPWIAKDWFVTGNPVAPFFTRIFRTPYQHVIAEQEYNQYLQRYTIENKWTLPLEITVRGEKTQGLLGPIFLLTPLALLSLRFREGRRLLLTGALLLTTYLANVGTRFLLPAVPFFSLALALGLPNWPPLFAALMLMHAWLSWPSHIAKYGGQYSWHLDRILYKHALRKIPEEKYLSQNFWGYDVARMVDATVPDGAKVLAVNGVPDAYTSREILVGFQGAWNQTLLDMLNLGWDENSQPTRRLSFKFPARSIERVRVLQTGYGAPHEQWNVHELRFFYAGKELARRPEWRLRAWPNPWEVQLAFDNSPATRWRSWEVAWPGMYIDTDFGRAETIDEVAIETSPDYLNIRLEVQVLDDQSHWVKIAGNPKEDVLPPPAGIRMLVSREIHARGVDYILIYDTDWGADDMHEDPESWGFAEVAHGWGARIYKIVPPKGKPQAAR